MARQELHSDTLKIDQMPPIVDTGAYEGDIVLTERTHQQDYLDELAFMQEPVQVRLEPSSDKNAAGSFPVWVNGKMAEILGHDGRWREIGYLPVGQVLTVRRSVLEVIIRAKTDTIQTRILEQDGERPNNVVNRFTSPVHSFSIIEDRNPRGAAWVQELRRRNL